MTHNLLVIDPGISIGWAVFQDGVAKHAGTASIDDDLDQVWLGIGPNQVVIEFVLSITHSQLGRQLVDLDARLRRMFPNASYIRPGQWKPITGNAPIPIVTHTKHERDAIRMGVYWLRLHPLQIASAADT